MSKPPGSPRLRSAGQLPSQIHRGLHAGVEALAARREMHVRGVAGQQDPPACRLMSVNLVIRMGLWIP